MAPEEDERLQEANTIARLKSVLAGLRLHLRQMPLHFTVGQYNILAGYLGKNMEPWFLYGVDMPEERRRRIIKLHHERDSEGRYVHLGWPNYVRGILSDEEIKQVERVHGEHFRWDKRKTRILNVIASLDVDLLSIVECDHYDGGHASSG